MADTVLRVNSLSMAFGGLRALDGVDLDVKAGEIVALIGPNGAGKTTLFNCITGIYKPTGGDVLLAPPGGKEARLNGLKPNRVTALGIARTFQNIRLFPHMSTIENVMVGRHCRTRAGILGALLRGPATRAEERETVRVSHELLERVGLAALANETAANLSYGAQRRLEIARALATEPHILLLDEPAAGMNPQETRDLDALVSRLRRDLGLAVLLIEHDMKFVMSISERIFVLDYGRRIAAGLPAEVAADPAVIRAYLGEEAAEG